MKKLGLDVGSSSLGWFLRDGDEIIDFGAITFETGMVKGTAGYSSPTKDRREARLKRNPIKARKYRKVLMLKYLVSSEMVPLESYEIDNWANYKKGYSNQFPSNSKFKSWLACDFIFDGGKKYKNPYELRVKALDEQLTKMELGRALYHLVQRRGFKDIGETNKETKKQIEIRKESGFQEALNSHKNRTIAEALQKEYLEKNKRARNNYPYRDEYEDELLKILTKQGYSLETDEDKKYEDNFVRNIHKAVIWQQPLKTQKGNIGKCTLEPKKKRCAVSHPLFEISRAWQFINTIKAKATKDDDYEFLPKELREQLYEKFFLKKDKNFKFEIFRKTLDRFYKKEMLYNYPLDSKKRTYETTIAGMPFCMQMIKFLGNQAHQDLSQIENYTISSIPKNYNGYSLLDIWHNITEFDEIALEKFGKEKLHLKNKERKRNEEVYEISPLVEIKNKLPKGYGSLSQFVLRKIIPLLKDGFLYNDAVLLANIPDALGDEFEKQKEIIVQLLKDANQFYSERKRIIRITNSLVEKYKGEVEANNNGEENSLFAYNDFTYTLQTSDKDAIEKQCENHFGEKRWERFEEKDKLIQEVGFEYQEFFFDENRDYRKLEKLQDIFETKLAENNIQLNKQLYHHSNRENIYGKPIKYRDTDIDILPLAQTSSIKNPMFNKAMAVLRKLVNQLIIDGKIDKETEIIVEIARELNDNNKRIAIERYQKQREAKRKKIREFLEEYKTKEKSTLNIEENIHQFELWDEQVFEETEDYNGNIQKNRNRKEILNEKSAVKRYELWMEQKGQCMYTGKMISISQLFSSTIDIEHTIPRKLLPDNTLANLTVAYKDYNTNIKKTTLPFELPNYEKDVEGKGTAIEPRLKQWVKEREYFKTLFEIRQKPKGAEDENAKNKRIQEKHFFKMHYDYWKDKLERFTEEPNDKWTRRQLTDTQNISKYAREFLKTYFNRVNVQKGSVTADFRKMLKLEDKDNPKDRAKHTHHTIDASVLTYIPSNASRKDALIKEMGNYRDNYGKQKYYNPHNGFNAQKIKSTIEENTLIYNYTKDNTTVQTYKKVRVGGKIQYKKDNNGNNILTEPLYSKGDTIRTSLFKDTFLGKIKDVERDEDGNPSRNETNTDWEYKTGDEEFIYVKKEPIEKISRTNIKDIIDPHLAKLIESQLGKEPKDWQGNKIRHVRIKKKAGKKVKSRIDYRSDKEYKNYYYSESGDVTYGVMLFKTNSNERELLQVHAYQVSEVYRKHRKFDAELFVKEYYPQKGDYKKLLLKKGQRLLVLNNDEDYNNRKDIDFQKNRLYKIIRIGDGSLWLKYHLTAIADTDLDSLIKEKKDELLWKYEKELGLSKVIEDLSIPDIKDRNEDLQRRKYKFNSWSDFRIERIIEHFGKEKASEIKSELDKFKKVSSFIEIEGETHLLKLNTSESWNFLYEGTDFEISILGKIKFK